MTYEIDLQTRIYLRGKAVNNILTITFDNLPEDLIQENSYGVINSEWNEPREFGFETNQYYYILNNYPEYPLEHMGFHSKRVIIGVFFNGNEWEDMAGYRPPNFSPGYCWKPEYVPNQYQNQL